MKALALLIWLTQLGLSVALSLGGFVVLAVWLHDRYDLGVWVIVLGVVLGLICAIDALRSGLKAINNIAKLRGSDKKHE